MALELVRLPSEVQVMIFEHSNDLDDASHLGQTCRLFRDQLATNKRKIERAIITHSNVHEYDYCLSNFLNANERLRTIYKRERNTLSFNGSHNFQASQGTLPDEKRPHSDEFWACIAHPTTGPPITNEMIADISARWKKYQLFRHLYLDDTIYEEYNNYRGLYLADLDLESSFHPPEPGVHIPCGWPRQLRLVQAFRKDFKTEFYKCLCLLSISIASHHLGMMSALAETDEAWNIAHAIWIKSEIHCNGARSVISTAYQLQSLEVFDFVYCFLLGKVLPSEKALDWLDACGDEDWPLSRLDDWTEHSHLALLYHCSYTVNLEDILDMIQNKAWSDEVDYPPDLTSYMRTRGMFDLGHSTLDWFTAFERDAMVENILRSGPKKKARLKGTAACRWWNTFRISAGSPFSSTFPFDRAK